MVTARDIANIAACRQQPGGLSATRVHAKYIHDRVHEGVHRRHFYLLLQTQTGAATGGSIIRLVPEN